MKQITVNVPARIIGLDLSDESSRYCVIDGRNEILLEGSVRTTAPGLKEFFGSQEASRVVLEASTHSGWVAKAIRALGHQVTVVNPRRLQLISASVSKTDRNDARLLARVGRLDVGILQPVHTKNDDSIAMRVQLRARAQLVSVRTRLVNLVRSTMKSVGCKPPACSADVFHEKVELPELVAVGLEPVLKILRNVQMQIEGYEKRLAADWKRCPQRRLFEGIHGVGPILSLAFVATIEDPERFKSSRTVGAYFGLAPRVYQSGKSDPGLRISKHGDGMLRSLLVSAAAHITRRTAPDSDLKRYGTRLAKSGAPRDKGRARIAVARKLAVLMHRLWVTGEVYRPLRAEPA